MRGTSRLYESFNSLTERNRECRILCMTHCELFPILPIECLLWTKVIACGHISASIFSLFHFKYLNHQAAILLKKLIA